MAEKEHISIVVSVARKSDSESDYYPVYSQTFDVASARQVAAQIAYFANKMFLNDRGYTDTSDLVVVTEHGDG